VDEETKMATNYIPFHNGKSAPEVPILGLLVVLSNYEMDRLWPEWAKDLQAWSWVLNELVRAALAAHFPVVARYLPEASKVASFLLDAGLCSWHFIGVVPGWSMLANVLTHL